MDSKKVDTKTSAPVAGRETSLQLYNPWSMIWKPRSRSDSEHSISSSVSTQSFQSGTSSSSLQRQTSRADDEYLWMVKTRRTNEFTESTVGMGDENLNQVNEFVYQGSVDTRNEKSDEDVKGE